MRRAFLLTAFLPLILCSCSSGAYSDRVSCEEIAECIISQLGDEEYLELDGADAEYYFSIIECSEYSIRYSSSTNNIDEFGIFHADDSESALELLEECQDYLKEKQTEQRAFIQSYAPTEIKKLDGADAFRFGNYVVFTVLDKDTSAKIRSEVERLLAE